MFLAQKSLLFLGVYGSYDAYVRHGSLAKVERRQKPLVTCGRWGWSSLSALHLVGRWSCPCAILLVQTSRWESLVQRLLIAELLLCFVGVKLLLLLLLLQKTHRSKNRYDRRLSTWDIAGVLKTWDREPEMNDPEYWNESAVLWIQFDDQK